MTIVADIPRRTSDHLYCELNILKLNELYLYAVGLCLYNKIFSHVATNRDPHKEDNAGVWIAIVIADAQKYAYGATKTRNKKQQHKKPDIKHISNRNSSNLRKC